VRSLTTPLPMTTRPPVTLRSTRIAPALKTPLPV
jgi:hypothetical protein